MIEITHYKPFENSAKLATFSIKVPKWGNFLIRELSLFQKGSHKWISFPSRQYEADGKKKYFSFNGFEDQKMNEAFQDQVLKAIDKYLQSQNNQQQLPIGNEEIPF